MASPIRRIASAVGNELRHPRFEYRKRHRPQSENRVVELSLIERGPQPLLSLTTMPADLNFTQLVRERLPGPGDVPFHFGRDLVLGQRRVLPEKVHRSFTSPSELVDS